MLYGRTSKTQIWDIKNVTSEPALFYSENNRVIGISGLFESLKEKSDSGLFFYVYNYQKKERYVFVTTSRVDFLSLNNPDNMTFSGICTYVKGALWDLWEKKFVSFDRPEGFFLEFCLYDAGIPNMVFDRTEKRYTVAYLKDEDYHFIECKKRYQPTIVSHLWKENKVGRPVNNRIFFVTPEDKDDEDMLILHEEIEFDSYNENVEFLESFPLNLESDSDKAYFISAHGKEAKGHPLQDEDIYNVKHLVFDDAIIVQQVYGEYNIVFVQDGKVIFDDEFDCVDYEKVFFYDAAGNEKRCKENIVKVTYKRNDFENGEATFNITTGRITH